jgi:hypothetical protein
LLGSPNVNYLSKRGPVVSASPGQGFSAVRLTDFFDTFGEILASLRAPVLPPRAGWSGRGRSRGRPQLRALGWTKLVPLLKEANSPTCRSNRRYHSEIQNARCPHRSPINSASVYRRSRAPRQARPAFSPSITRPITMELINSPLSPLVVIHRPSWSGASPGGAGPPSVYYVLANGAQAAITYRDPRPLSSGVRTRTDAALFGPLC